MRMEMTTTMMMNNLILKTSMPFALLLCLCLPLALGQLSGVTVSLGADTINDSDYAIFEIPASYAAS